MAMMPATTAMYTPSEAPMTLSGSSGSAPRQSKTASTITTPASMLPHRALSVTTDGSALTPTLGRTAITVHTKANTVPIQSQVPPFEPASSLTKHCAFASAAAEVASSMTVWFPPLKAVAMVTVISSTRSHMPAWVPLWTISVLFSGGVSSIGVVKYA